MELGRRALRGGGVRERDESVPGTGARSSPASKDTVCQTRKRDGPTG